MLSRANSPHLKNNFSFFTSNSQFSFSATYKYFLYLLYNDKNGIRKQIQPVNGNLQAHAGQAL